MLEHNPLGCGPVNVQARRQRISKERMAVPTDKSAKIDEVIGLMYKKVKLENERIMTMSVMSVLEKKFPGTDVRIGDIFSSSHIVSMFDSSRSYWELKCKVTEIVAWKITEIKQATGWTVEQRKAEHAILSALAIQPNIRAMFDWSENEVPD